MQNAPTSEIPQQVIELIMSSPLVTPWREEEAGQESRKKWADEITALRQQEEAEVPQLEQASERARAAVEPIRQTYEQAQQKAYEAEQERFVTQANLSWRRERLENL